MQRPTFEEIYMSLADTISKRSTCSRLKVGTVITSTDYRKVLALGYNGAASGLPNRCERDEPGNCGCATHAELNAMINCDTPRYVEKIVFITHAPCINCAKALINFGNIKQIYYRDTYRDLSGVKLLDSVGIPIAQFSGGRVQESER